MNYKMGYLIIAIGIALVIWGIVLLAKPKTVENPVTATEKPRQVKVKSDDYNENKAKGDAFERPRWRAFITRVGINPVL